MSMPCETTLLKACRTLFGHEVNLSLEFLDYLQPSGAKSAFRSLAKTHHPDRHALASPQVHRQQTERFREIRQAYELINTFLERRPRRRQSSSVRPPAPPSTPRHSSPSPRHYRHREQAQSAAETRAIPAIPLEFGMYVYYQGKISYRQLIDALIWQRRQRPALGAIAQKWGWLSETRVAQILGHRGHAARFGSKAIELGYLRPLQVEALIKHQRSLQQRIGRYFVEQGWLSEEQADQLASSLAEHNSRVGSSARHHFRTGG